MNPQFYIFGIQRSGTNYFCTLLDQNFGASLLNPGQGAWKHSIEVPKKWDSSQQTFLIYKNPYTWVESIICRMKVDWFKTQLTYPGDEQHEDDDLMYDGMNIENIAKTWKHFHDTWLNQGLYHFRYEMLLMEESRDEILDTIQQQTGWESTSSSLDGSWSNVNAGSVNLSSKFKVEDKEYYKKCEPKVLTDKQISCVTQTIGVDMIESLGYKAL